MSKLRWLFVPGFLLSGIYHIVGLINPLLTEPSPPWRHLLFVGINFVAAAILIINRKRLLLLLLPLVIQQIYGHTIYGLHVYNTQGRIDWASVIVCLSMPILGILILKGNYELK
jgi:hypothetical protein